MDPYCIHTELIYQLAEERMWDLHREAKAQRMERLARADPAPKRGSLFGLASLFMLFLTAIAKFSGRITQ